MRARLPGMPDEAIDNTLDIAERCDARAAVRPLPVPGVPGAEGRHPRGPARARARAGLEERLAVLRQHGGRGAPSASSVYQERLDDELDVIKRMGFAGYFLIVADFTNYAKRQGIPGRPRPRLGRRQPGRVRAAHHRPRSDPVQPALRALPQSRAQVDARHRHRLLLRAPRRGHPLRARAVRRGPRRADHHVRDAEGEGGDQGRRPRARVHLRRDRQDRQALPGAEAGQGLPARRGAARWSRACASCATRASASSSCSTHALQARGPAAPRLQARRRHRHRLRGRWSRTCRSSSTKRAAS